MQQHQQQQQINMQRQSALPRIHNSVQTHTHTHSHLPLHIFFTSRNLQQLQAPKSVCGKQRWQCRRPLADTTLFVFILIFVVFFIQKKRVHVFVVVIFIAIIVVSSTRQPSIACYQSFLATFYTWHILVSTHTHTYSYSFIHVHIHTYVHIYSQVYSLLQTKCWKVKPIPLAINDK